MPYSFAEHLVRFGPDAHYPVPDLAQARSYCARLTRDHYENFSVVSTLLPRRLVLHFYPLYAYCRWADDLGDETGGGQTALDLLAWWRIELLRLFNGQAKHPVMIALRPTIDRFAIPAQPFLDLITAFEQDQRIKRHATYAQLLDYCAYSANPVGRLVLYVCSSFTPRNAELADTICTGLQLANFWQDVRRDFAELGRVYLPEEDRRRFGVSDDDLRHGHFTPAFRDLMRFEIGRARELFERGRPLLELVPNDVRPDIQLFLAGGLAILDKIEAVGFDVLGGRPELSRRDKAQLVLGALGQKLLRNPSSAAAPCRLNGALRRSSNTQASFRWCHRLARRTARNFYFAFQVLPRARRQAMEALYAFMRITDDLADEPGEPAAKSGQLEQWRTALDRALAGEYSHSLHPALHAIVERYGIAPRHLHEVIEGVRGDLEPVRFRGFAELYGYCYRVASAVGLCCIRIWGYHNSKAVEYAEAAGIAFQLTNILRDLGEDLERGRIYLPQEDIERFGSPPESWRQCGESFRALMRFQVERARVYYRQAEHLSEHLDAAGRAIFQVMMRIYRGLLEEIARRDYDVFGRRVRLSKRRKFLYLIAAFPTKWGWAMKSNLRSDQAPRGLI